MPLKGSTQSCPNTKCKKILFREAEFDGCGTFSLKCPHCNELVSVEVSKKSVIKATVVIPLIALAVIFICGALRIQKLESTLAELSYQQVYIEK